MSEKKIIVLRQGEKPTFAKIGKKVSAISQKDIAKTIVEQWGEFGEDELVVLQPLAGVLDYFKTNASNTTIKDELLENAAAGISFMNGAKRAIQFEKKQGKKITPQLVLDILVAKKAGIEYTMVEAREKKLESVEHDESIKMRIVAKALQEFCDANGLELTGQLQAK